MGTTDIPDVRQCPSCSNYYSGQVCVDCFTQAPNIEQEKYVTEYIKNLKHHVTQSFGRIKGKKTIINTVDDPTDDHLEYIKQIKEDMWENMMNNSPTRMKNYTIAEQADIRLEQEKRREQEKEQEQDKPTLKLFQIHVWKTRPNQKGVVGAPARELMDFVIMLSEDLSTAGNQMHENFGYEELGHTVEIEEVMGPFKSGDILSSWDSE